MTQDSSSHPPPSGDTAKERESLVAEAHRLALERKEASDAAEAPAAPRVPRGPLAVVLVVILAIVGAWNVVFFTGGGPAGVEDEEALLRGSVYMLALSIDGHWEETGAPPATLDEIGEDDPDVQYIPFENGYQLTASGEHTVVTFSSGDDLAPFEAAFRARFDRGSIR